MPNLVELAKKPPNSAWQELKRSTKRPRKTQQTRAKRPNFKEQFVIEKEYKNKRLEKEFVAEFDYQPVACDCRRRPENVAPVGEWRPDEKRSAQMITCSCHFRFSENRKSFELACYGGQGCTPIWSSGLRFAVAF